MSSGRWEAKFNKMFKELEHSWNLEVLNDTDGKIGWSKVHYKGKSTFECSNVKCENKWPCINSGLVFYYRLSGFGIERHGEVKLFIGGQKCMECRNDVFESPQWPDSQIESAIAKVLNEINQKVYGKTSAMSSVKEDTEKQAWLAAFHQKNFSHLCQLCCLGICQDIESGKNHYAVLAKLHNVICAILTCTKQTRRQNLSS